MKLTTRKLVTAGMLSAIAIVLGLTPLGFIPVGPVKATIMHIPVIIAAIIEGPLVGLVVGLIFGLTSMFQAAVMPTSPVAIVFLDPLVAVLPRLIIPVAAYLVYSGVKTLYKRSALTQKKGVAIASFLAAAVGTLVNTVGVLFMIYVRHAAEFAEKISTVLESPISVESLGRYLIAAIAIPQGSVEVVVAAVIVTAVVKALQKLYKSEI